MDKWICPDCRAVHEYLPKLGCARTVAREEDGTPIRCAVFLVPYVNGKAVRKQAEPTKPKAKRKGPAGRRKRPAARPKTGRKCGICKKPGHRRETCPDR